MQHGDGWSPSLSCDTVPTGTLITDRLYIRSVDFRTFVMSGSVQPNVLRHPRARPRPGRNRNVAQWLEACAASDCRTGDDAVRARESQFVSKMITVRSVATPSFLHSPYMQASILRGGDISCSAAQLYPGSPCFLRVPRSGTLRFCMVYSSIWLSDGPTTRTGP
jgi:hypothetical protein